MSTSLDRVGFPRSPVHIWVFSAEDRDTDSAPLQAVYIMWVIRTVHCECMHTRIHNEKPKKFFTAKKLWLL